MCSSPLFDSLTIEENTGFYLTEHADPETGQRATKGEIRDRVDEHMGFDINRR